MGCGDVRLLRTIGGVDFTRQERATLNKLTMPDKGFPRGRRHDGGVQRAGSADREVAILSLLDWRGLKPFHVDTARELDDRRAPGPMPSARCAPRSWTVFKRRRHVSRGLRCFLNQRDVGIGVTELAPRVFLMSDVPGDHLNHDSKMAPNNGGELRGHGSMTGVANAESRFNSSESASRAGREVASTETSSRSPSLDALPTRRCPDPLDSCHAASLFPGNTGHTSVTGASCMSSPLSSSRCRTRSRAEGCAHHQRLGEREAQCGQCATPRRRASSHTGGNSHRFWPKYAPICCFR